MTTTTQDRLPLTGCDDPEEWRVEDHHREAGRRGLAEARAALAAATRRAADRDAARAGGRHRQAA